MAGNKIHYLGEMMPVKYWSDLEPGRGVYKTLCGYVRGKEYYTDNPDKVTCKLCLREIKKFNGE